MIDLDELKTVLRYDAGTGHFWWVQRTSPKARMDKPAGCLTPFGYVSIRYKQHTFKGHRLAWLFTYGYTPNQIDHINGKKDDNRLCNLRACNSSQNQMNAGKRRDNRSGFKGVHLERKTGRWRAMIRINGKLKGLGYYDTPHEAHSAYATEAAKLFKQFARTD